MTFLRYSKLTSSSFAEGDEAVGRGELDLDGTSEEFDDAEVRISVELGS